jgi:hypothetical protein
MTLLERVVIFIEMGKYVNLLCGGLEKAEAMERTLYYVNL